MPEMRSLSAEQGPQVRVRVGNRITARIRSHSLWPMVRKSVVIGPERVPRTPRFQYRGNVVPSKPDNSPTNQLVVSQVADCQLTD